MSPAAIPVPASHAAEVARRLARFRADGNRGRPWRDVLDDIDATETRGSGAARRIDSVCADERFATAPVRR